MVALAHSTGAFPRHPMIAHMSKFACAVIVEMLLRVLGILKIVSLANLVGIRRILAITFLVRLVTILPLDILIVTLFSR